jgi:hypothetical protein
MTPEQIQALLERPALAPPPGIEPNFVNPPDLKAVDYAVMSIAILLPTIAIALRLYTKAFVIRKPGLEDWVALLGWALFMVFCAWTVVLAKHGLGRHQWDVRLVDMQQILYVSEVIFGTQNLLIPCRLLMWTLYSMVSRLPWSNGRSCSNTSGFLAPLANTTLCFGAAGD